MKKCPYCAEEIMDTARVCNYCRNDIRIFDLKNIKSSVIQGKDYYLLAIFSFILGAYSCSTTSFGGLVIAIVGLILGIIGRESTQRPFAFAGIVLSAIGLIWNLFFKL